MPMMRLFLRAGRQRAFGARFGGVAGLYSFFIAAMCLHALHAWANPLQAQSHWSRMNAILCHSPSFDTDIASYSYSATFRTRIVPRFPVKLRTCSATTTGKIQVIILLFKSLYLVGMKTVRRSPAALDLLKADAARAGRGAAAAMAHDADPAPAQKRQSPVLSRAARRWPIKKPRRARILSRTPGKARPARCAQTRAGALRLPQFALPQAPTRLPAKPLAARHGRQTGRRGARRRRAVQAAGAPHRAPR